MFYRTPSLKKTTICLFGDASNLHFNRWVMALKNCGVKVNVITYRTPHNLSGMNIYDLSCSNMRGNLRLEKYLRICRGIKMFFMLRRVLRKIKPDILHIHYLINTPLAFGFYGINRIILSPWGNDIINDTGKESKLKILYKKILLRRATAITATSKFLGRHIKNYINRKIVIIPFGVDTSLFDGIKQASSGGIVISFIKHLEEKYGARYLIEAIPLILEQYKNIKIYIAGTGSQDLFLKDLTNRLQIESYVAFLGKLNHTQVVDLLRKTDIFVMPSIYKSEVFGVAAIEASAMKIPVIASDLEGIREAIVDGVTGILVPPGDSKAIAEACINLIKNPDLRKSMGERGRQYVKDNFEWNDCVEKMLKVYEQVLHNEKK